MAASAKELVERFYDIVWNRADEAEARAILDADFRFRASLGPELRGPGGFIAYMRSVRAALENFICTIDDIIGLLTAQPLTVAMLGFSPGFAFLEGLRGRG